jgi:hypothetical protein
MDRSQPRSNASRAGSIVMLVWNSDSRVGRSMASISLSSRSYPRPGRRTSRVDRAATTRADTLSSGPLWVPAEPGTRIRSNSCP